MASKHTVEKIGGTSMSRFDEVMKNVIIGDRKPEEMYQRVFVVSAYGKITNMLLEDKKTGGPGVFSRYADGHADWVDALEDVRKKMREYNRSFKSVGLDVKQADAFVDERIDGVRECLRDLMRVRSFGHLAPDTYLPAAREMLSAIGEAHSAYNSSQILKANGIQSCFVDLSRWKETEILTLDEAVVAGIRGIDLERVLPIATGYVKCDVGIMTHFDRGYSEITFAKLAALTHAREGIIHKEYHLCTGDPVLMGPDKVKVIGQTNFDIADQMSDLNMEAIHSRASMEMAHRNIPIRVKNAFEPGHPGTLITREYVSPEPKAEMICGREDITAISVYDSEMVGQKGYDYRLLSAFKDADINYIAKSTNANTISHYIPEKHGKVERCLTLIAERFPKASVTIDRVAIVSVLGSNMKDPNFLAIAARSLADAGIQVEAMSQSMHGVNMQFMVAREKAAAAQLALHAAFVA